jgi:hypothetical protein
MHLKLWVAGIGTGLMLVLGGLLAGPIESFAASATPTTEQDAATPQPQSQSQNGNSTQQNSGTPGTQNSDNCPHDNGGQNGNSTGSDATSG